MEDTKFTYEYVPHRGINRETFETYGVKTKVSPDGTPLQVGFKYSNGAIKVRSFGNKDYIGWEKNGKEASSAGLFGKDKFSSGAHKYVTITEGEYDALSLHQVLRAPVVSVQSAVTGVRDCITDLDWLGGFERIYLAFDGDEPGRKAAAAVAKLFDPNRVFLVKFTKRKDANEYLQHGEGEELKHLWWNSKKFLPEGIYSSLQEFQEILRERPRKGVMAYPSQTLNEMTYGIRTAESVLLTAMEGVGKTELMHAIEYNILKGTQDNVGAIFLEEPKGRHLQALAGLELGLPVHLPDCSCTEGEITSAIERVVSKDDRLYLYSHFGSDDPGVIESTIRFLVTARGCRYVLFDHISMAVSGLAGEDERRALDYLSTRLEMMVKELDFALILVSHVNDMGQTRGSRYISKIADIRIDAHRDINNLNDLERNRTYLTISKNRFSGRTGPAGVLQFDPLTYRYKEMEHVEGESSVPLISSEARRSDAA